MSKPPKVIPPGQSGIDRMKELKYEIPIVHWHSRGVKRKTKVKPEYIVKF